MNRQVLQAARSLSGMLLRPVHQHRPQTESANRLISHSDRVQAYTTPTSKPAFPLQSIREDEQPEASYRIRGSSSRSLRRSALTAKFPMAAAASDFPFSVSPSSNITSPSITPSVRPTDSRT